MTPTSQLSLSDAAELLGWSVIHVRRMVKAGEMRLGDGPDIVLWDDVRRLALRSHRLPSLASDEQLEAAEPPTWLSEENRLASLPPATLETERVIQGNCLDVMRTMPIGLVQTVVTSPPYWGIRRYPDDQLTTWADGATVAFGQERHPEDYVRHTLEILHHLRRVVRQDGVVWWNVGDTYNTRSHVRPGSGERLDALEGRRGKESWKNYPTKRYSAGHPYLKDKDLTLIPFQIALGAQRIGWWVRSVVIWSKTNTVPESVKDRPTVTHEYILMLTQARFYQYFPEKATENAVSDWSLSGGELGNGQRNHRSVWQMGTSVGHGNHAAAFPLSLPLRCIRATAKAGDIVFDPFTGSGTTLVAAKTLGCRYFGCDISPTYVAEATERLMRVEDEADLPAEPTYQQAYLFTAPSKQML